MEVKLCRSADVIVVKDLNFGCVPAVGKLSQELAVVMLLGLRVVLPGYLHVDGNKDGNNTSAKFTPAAKVKRGVILTDSFWSKHRHLTHAIENACLGSNGCELISAADEPAWKAAKRNVSTLDSLSALADALRSDSRHDRKRSAAGKFQT